MDLQLKGKSVIVTGGASNIGREIVLGFAAEGANITIGDIDSQQADEVSKEALERGASSVQVAKTDVTDLAQVERLFTKAAESYGKIDVLVNNVGWDKLMYFTETTPEFWQRIIQVNYVGVLNCTHAALKLMIPARQGAIISISSDASRQGEPREAVYGGTKAAVNSFMKTIAKENGRYGIRCNVVCPGVTVPETAQEVGGSSMWAQTGEMFTTEQFEKIAKALPLRKLGRPRDIAGAVAFLASPVAGHITGQVLSVSGGYSMIG
ncbi:SDR family NAD(P)-dependent oxidoreductase [Variovorax sp. VNK109]|uniref:SDR family NAD(P)-dependent oxidoreductase n=1 Tax=Variovorax sp. VNK109 TaxID=3400919 RepID=UPI003C09E695